MKLLVKSFALILVGMVYVQCGTTSKVSVDQQLSTAWETADFQTVYDISTTAIKKEADKGKVTTPQMLQYAGESALKLKKTDDARKYLEQAMNLAPELESLYPPLVELYGNIDNLSYQITTLENYKKRFPAGEFSNELNVITFEAYAQSENWDLAFDTWGNLTDAGRQKIQLLETYLVVCDKLNREKEMEEAVSQLLQLDPHNIAACTVFATDLYEGAESRYQKEMKAYNGNKTRKQYAVLLKALDQSTGDFKKARDLFEYIYKEKPSKDVASYLSNIYARLNNKEKAAHYKKLSM